MVMSPNEWEFLKAPNKQKYFVQRLNFYQYLFFDQNTWGLENVLHGSSLPPSAQCHMPAYIRRASWGLRSQWESLVGTRVTVREPCGDLGHSERTSRGPGSQLSSIRGPGFLYMATQSFRRDSRNPGPMSQQVKQEKDTSLLTCLSSEQRPEIVSSSPVMVASLYECNIFDWPNKQDGLWP